MITIVKIFYTAIVCFLLGFLLCWAWTRPNYQGTKYKQIRADFDTIKRYQSNAIKKLGNIENGLETMSGRIAGVEDRIIKTTDRIGKIESRFDNMSNGIKTNNGLINEGLGIIKTTREENKKASH